MTASSGDYTPAPLPADELPRLNELRNLDILEGGKEQRFDRYTELAADIFNCPVSIITLIDKDYQWFKSCYGAPMDGTPRDIAFCGYTLLEKETMIIPNMLEDKRFINHPLVVGEPHVRFYAGTLLKGPNNYALGTFCLIDFTNREFSESDHKRLRHIGKMIEHELHFKHHLNQLRKHVENTIYYDAPTDLPTKRLFQERLLISIKKKIDTENKESMIFVLCLGIPALENVRIVSGQNAVNLVIKEINWHLQKILGPDFNIAKGNETNFLISGTIALHDKWNEELQKIVNNILSIFQDTLKVGTEVYETLIGKIGIAIYETDDVDANELTNKAVLAMTMILNSDENSCTYSACSTAHISKAFHLENNISKAIRNNKFHLEYQPIVNVQTGLICGAEVLCRWVDPELGHISPEDFIPVAEQSGLIIPLGEWVFREAVQGIKMWTGENIIDFPISINVSGSQITKINFFEEIKQILEEENVPPSLINLEVTEASLIYDIELAIKNMEKATEIGITFSLDDFGTGFSSLKYLQRLPVKYLKIDKSFVERMTTHANDSALVQAIIALAKTLGLEVVAEGIETNEQFMFLKTHQCHRAQGYLFSRSLQIDDFLKIVQQQNHLNIDQT